MPKTSLTNKKVACLEYRISGSTGKADENMQMTLLHSLIVNEIREEARTEHCTHTSKSNSSSEKQERKDKTSFI